MSPSPTLALARIHLLNIHLKARHWCAVAAIAPEYIYILSDLLWFVQINYRSNAITLWKCHGSCNKTHLHISNL